MGFAKRLHLVVLLAVMISGLPGSIFSRPQQTPGAVLSSPQTVQAPVPDRATDILSAAAQANGLGATGLKPWHILVTYDVFDEDGDNVSSGTYEEFWVGPKQYRLTFTGDDFNHTDVATTQGLYRTGDQAWPGEIQTRVRDQFVRPMFREMNFIYGTPEKTTRDFGQLKLPCVQLQNPRSNSGIRIIITVGLAAFCFEPNSVMLRYAHGGMSPLTTWDEARYQKIVRFQNQYVPSEVQVTRAGKKFLEMHLEKLELVKEIKSDDFAPPQNATLIGSRITVDNKVLLLDYVLHMETPEYPHTPGKSGSASVTFVIQKDGHVADVQFVSGAPEMKKPLEKALAKFAYRPFLVMGEPVEVEVTQGFQYESH